MNKVIPSGPPKHVAFWLAAALLKGMTMTFGPPLLALGAVITLLVLHGR